MQPLKPYITASRAADILDISALDVEMLAEVGELRAVEVDGRIAVSQEDVDRLQQAGVTV